MGQLLKARTCRSCNLCGEPFIPRQQFLIFCDRCRSENEVYRFSEWLPEGSLNDMTPVVAKIAA